MKLSELVEKYIELRDKKAEIRHAYEEKANKIDAVLEQIEGTLLKAFDAAGLDSAKTSAGTAYTSTRTTASVADKDSFMDFVKANSEWHLLETRCSKTAVEQFKEVNGEVPPGVNWREERVVNIRRS